jgi:hypothetical protein
LRVPDSYAYHDLGTRKGRPYQNQKKELSSEFPPRATAPAENHLCGLFRAQRVTAPKEMAMCKTEYLTVEETAASLNTTPMAILMLLRRGGLLGKEVESGGWLVERGSLEQLRAARQGDAPLIECRSSCAAKAGGCASCGSTAE